VILNLARNCSARQFASDFRDVVHDAADLLAIVFRSAAADPQIRGNIDQSCDESHNGGHFLFILRLVVRTLHHPP